jgi:signal transduction histidine kinase
MQPDAPPEVYREFLGDINSEIDRENKIITDLLELVKLDRNNGELHIAMVSVNELLEILMKRIKPIAQTRNVELIYESYRKVDAEIDEVKVMLALSNLVENAVKYNTTGGWVKVTLDSDHKYFTVTVADSGIGIPEESLGMIFERFYRVDKMRARKTGGTGLGLSITKSVIMMHNGTINVESTEGEGTTFIVKIPLTFIENNSTEA